MQRHAVHKDTAAAVAANPNCPPELMRQLANGDVDAKRSLAANPNCVPALLARLATEGGIVTQHVAKNPNSPITLLERIAADPASKQRSRGYARYNLYTRRGQAVPAQRPV